MYSCLNIQIFNQRHIYSKIAEKERLLKQEQELELRRVSEREEPSPSETTTTTTTTTNAQDATTHIGFRTHVLFVNENAGTVTVTLERRMRKLDSSTHQASSSSTREDERQRLRHCQCHCVQYATRDGSANAPLDYIHTSGLVIFPPGREHDVQTFEIEIVDDVQFEPDECFYVDLFQPSSDTMMMEKILRSSSRRVCKKKKEEGEEGDRTLVTELFPTGSSEQVRLLLLLTFVVHFCGHDNPSYEEEDDSKQVEISIIIYLLWIYIQKGWTIHDDCVWNSLSRPLPY